MNWSPEIKSFIVQHLDDDTDRLLLSAHRYAGIDVPFAVDQILARRQIKNKLPEWFANENLIMGGKIPAEQCSSEQTAKYKRHLVVGTSLCDMTGGMGVDLFYMSQGLEKIYYTERHSSLCEVVEHNFKELGVQNVEIRNGDGRELPIPNVDTIYVDPARRANDGSRVYDVADCEPNVVEWHNELLSHCKRLVIKLSPMVDVSRLLDLLPSISQIHIVAVKGECKEVLVVCDRDKDTGDIQVYCIDFKSSSTIEHKFPMKLESESESKFAEKLGRYLYEPDVTLLKAGAFKSLCSEFEVEKLDVNSHLYTSETLRESFPGRIFEIEECCDFSSKILKTLKKTIAKANITARNFVMTADQLRQRTGIKDGGETYIFATQMKNNGNILLKCRKALLLILVMLMYVPCVSAKVALLVNNVMSAQPQNIEQLLAEVKVEPLSSWLKGKEFYYLNDNLNMLLVPEDTSVKDDSVNYKGSVWVFDAIVSEENWMGQQEMALRFISPNGRAYRYNTGRQMSQVADLDYRPAVSGLFPKEVIERLNDILNARTLYILLNDERISEGDTVRFEKFVPVVVDSVSFGDELAPVAVYYSYQDGRMAYVKTSLPGTRENSTSTSIVRFFSVTDPRLDYPEIVQNIWRMIQRGEVARDMSREECRLSWGKPMRFETFNTRNGPVERWFYSGSRVLEFWNGRLNSIGRER